LSHIRHRLEQTKLPDETFLLANIIEQFTILLVQAGHIQKGRQVDKLTRALVAAAAAVLKPPGPVLEIGSLHVQGPEITDLRHRVPGELTRHRGGKGKHLRE